MKVAGIIAEYNPFHNGHTYHIEETRKKTGADYVVVAMSGNFVQRGAPALLDKFTRAKMALQNGADLVLEIPTIGTIASAETYARSGINLLSSLGIVDHLSFGCEESTPNGQSLLSQISDLFYDAPTSFTSTLKNAMKKGHSYPEAISLSAQNEIADDNISKLLQQPNNILALEYLRELHKPAHTMTPLLIPRIGTGYHSLATTKTHASATAIRTTLSKKEPLNSKLVPPLVAKQLQESFAKDTVLFNHDFSFPLHYALLREKETHFRAYQQEPELAKRIEHLVETYTDIESFIDNVKSRNRTRTAISRYLMQVLLGITQVELTLFTQQENYCPYLRILGFHRDRSLLLESIKECATSSLVFSCKEALPTLSDAQKKILSIDLLASDIYHAAATAKSGVSYQNDLRHPLVYI